MVLRRRPFIGRLVAAAAGAALSGCGPASGPARRRPPNVILFYSDDAGYSDFGIHGCEDIATPHIDSIGLEGVRFSSGYVSAPVCSPSRAGLLTGRYQVRFGHECNRHAESPGLPREEITLPELLAEAGYATGLVGKWHLGLAEISHPLDNGFQEFFGSLHYTRLHAPKEAGGKLLYTRGRENVRLSEARPAAITREAVAFVERHAAQPFFLYVPWEVPHWPVQMLPGYDDRVQHIDDVQRRKYAMLMLAMDDGVGRILDTVRRAGLDRDTMVFFLNDNGGPVTRGQVRNNLPLRGGKGMLLEGGIRVVFLWRWPGRLPGGVVFPHPVISLDILPTVAAAAGVELPTDRRIDGVNLLPYLEGEMTGAPHDLLAWRTCDRPEVKSIRVGDWKLHLVGDDGVWLYNVTEDIGERRNLADRFPERVAAMRARLLAWDRDVGGSAYR